MYNHWICQYSSSVTSKKKIWYQYLLKNINMLAVVWVFKLATFSHLQYRFTKVSFIYTVHLTPRYYPLQEAVNDSWLTRNVCVHFLCIMILELSFLISFCLSVRFGLVVLSIMPVLVDRLQLQLQRVWAPLNCGDEHAIAPNLCHPSWCHFLPGVQQREGKGKGQTGLSSTS